MKTSPFLSFPSKAAAGRIFKRSLLAPMQVAAILAAVAGGVAAEPLAVVATKFDKLDGSELAIAPAPSDMAGLPLTAPTKISAGSTSFVQPGKQAVGDLPPPFALIKIGARETNPEAPSNVAVEWDMKDVGLEPGRYSLTCRVAFAEAAQDGGNLFLTVLDSEGNEIKSHAGNLAHISFGGGFIQCGRGGKVPFSTGDVYQLEVVVDTKQLTWSASVNGEPIREEGPFSQDVMDQLSGGCRIGKALYLALGGMDNSRPGSTLALADVSVKKVD